MSQENISPIHVGMALQSLRNSDFDIYSAICEIIDNSIQADSHEIKIRIKSSVPEGKKKPRPNIIAFGDDGNGMDKDLLQYCLKLGWSGRYNDRKGIGRFGVGMTYGAITLCQRIEVYSREHRGNWHHTFLDISDQNSEPVISLVQQKDLPKDFADLVGDHGTLVIWNNIDRINETVNEDELIHRIGRIYRKFIGKEIIEEKEIVVNPNIRTIYVNGVIVNSHDPLYVTKSKFQDDETTVVDHCHTMPYSVHYVDKPDDESARGTIRIRVSLLPESWRKRLAKSASTDPEGKGAAGDGNSSCSKRRKITENEGISILRNGREVFYGHIANWSPKLKEIDRWWGCEIDFDPVLDHWFSVKNIKNGAKPLIELREDLQKKLKGQIENYRRAIQKTAKDHECQMRQDDNGPSKSHKDAEEKLNSNINPKKTDKTPEDIQKNAKEHSEEISNDPKEQEIYVNEVTSLNSNYKIIEDVQARSDGPLIDIITDLGKNVVHYNMNHGFFQAVYARLNDIDKIANQMPENEKLQEISKKLKLDIDNLIYGYVEAYYKMDNSEIKEQSTNNVLEDLMQWWSQNLRNVYRRSS